MTKPPPANRTRLLAITGAAIVLAVFVIWLNFGRGGGTPPADALEAARAAAADMTVDEPPPDPSAPPQPAPVPSPARPTPLGGR